ncbi:MAG: LysR family transcriptional regulator substrate-binding protein [Lawsonibacter sp.]
MPFILLKRGNRVRGIVDQYLSRCYFKPKIILETENTVTTLAMAREGMGIVICPQLFLRTIHLPGVKPAPEDVDLFPLADPSTLSRLVVGYRRDRYLSHFAERFILIAQDVLRK